MASTRCPNCNFLNFANQPECKRCRQPIGTNVPEAAYAGYEMANVQGVNTGAAGQFSQQPPPRRPAPSSYYNPPPPNFYDELRAGHAAPVRNNYERTVTISIPPVCVKCGRHDDLSMKKFKKDYTPPLAYLGFLLGGLLPLVIVILICRKIHKMNGLFCADCYNRYRPHNVISTVTALLALVMMFAAMIIGVVANSAALGMFIFFAALGLAIWGNYYAKKVSPKYVKTNRKQVYISIPNYGEVEFTHSEAV